MIEELLIGSIKIYKYFFDIILKLWVWFPLQEMKYLIFSFLRSAYFVVCGIQRENEGLYLFSLDKIWAINNNKIKSKCINEANFKEGTFGNIIWKYKVI